MNDFKKYFIIIIIVFLCCMLGEGIFSLKAYSIENYKQKRLAFVIGNSNYKEIGYLKNTVNDAEQIAIELKKLNFRIFKLIDADRNKIKASLELLKQALVGTELVIFYYAGHGIAIDNTNYLLPIDADLTNADNYKNEFISLNKIIDLLKDAPRQVVVLLDACRDNPFVDQIKIGGRSVQRGLTVVEKYFPKTKQKGLTEVQTNKSDILIGFATHPGYIASDGEPGDRNSPFTKALIEHIHEKVEINELLRRVRVSVVKETNNNQKPWAHSSLIEPVFLAGKPEKNPGLKFKVKSLPPF